MTRSQSNLGPDADPDVLARWLAGEATAEEVRAVEGWMAADPARRREIDLLAASFRRLQQPPAADLDVEAALRSVKSRMQEPSSRVLSHRSWHQRVGIRPESPMLQAAAVLLVVAGAGLIWRATHDRQVPGASGTTTVAMRTISTGIGQRDSLTLSDGTRVTLGPSTTLRQYEEYGKTTREVDLAGEAYFDVRHDPSREFVVHTTSATIRDIGTTFDVQTAGGPVDVRVAVTSGSVLLKGSAGTPDSVVLRAGDRGILDGAGRTIAQRKSVTADDLAWLRGRLIFRNTPLTEAAEQIRRWYGVELRFADPALRNQHLTATFDGEPKAQVLKTIALALGAGIELRGDTAILHSHGF
jgi:transmembrane sensor